MISSSLRSGRPSAEITSRCVAAEQGTVVDLTGMNRILSIEKEAKTITMEAGVLQTQEISSC